jgi:hypothetical protein
MTDLSRASAPDDGVARRTILAGAAWSIPVIATATVAPAASASGTLALAFNQASYTGTACSTITGAYVTATTDGSPTVGASITVSASADLTFETGGPSITGITDTDGRFFLPGLRMGPSPVIGSMTATAPGSAGVATVTTQAGASAFGYFGGNSTPRDAINVPAGSTNVYSDWFLTPEGKLIAANSGATIATGIASVGSNQANSWVGFTRLNGSFGYFGGNSTPRDAINVPAGSTNVYSDWFLTPEGKLIAANSGATIATGIASVGKNEANSWVGFTRRGVC